MTLPVGGIAGAFFRALTLADWLRKTVSGNLLLSRL